MPVTKRSVSTSDECGEQSGTGFPLVAPLAFFAFGCLLDAVSLPVSDRPQHLSSPHKATPVGCEADRLNLGFGANARELFGCSAAARRQQRHVPQTNVPRRI